MFDSPPTRPSAARRARLAFFAALTLSACGPRSILGRDDTTDAAVAEAGFDVPPADLPGSPDAPDSAAMDAPRADAADAAADVLVADHATDTAPADAMDAVTADVADASDATDAADAVDGMDVRDGALGDVADVTDATVDSGPLAPGILGSAARFTILAGSTVSNTGPSMIVGEVGVSPGTALVRIPAGVVVHAGDPVAALAQADTTIAYNYLAGLPCGTTLTGRDLGGMTLAPGVYCFSSSAQLTGSVVLDGQGQPNPLFVFQIGSTLVTSNAAAVVMIRGARPCGVYWQTGSSATIGIASNFAGNVIAFSSVTLTTGVTLNGRALARSGGVTLDSNTVSNASCPDPAPPTLSDAGASDAGASDASSDRPDTSDGG